MATSDSPIQMPADKFTADQKGHRANNSAVEAFGQASSYGFVPIGGLLAYAGAAPPPGYLECDGSAISRSTYGALFSVIGTNYGSGDGSTTFNLPTESQAVAIMTTGHTHGGVTAGAASTSAAASGVGIILIRTGAL